MTKKVAFFALLMACVPTEPEKDPRGGVSVTFAPSEATAGKPFQSSDGWTVQFEKVALRAVALGRPQNIGLGGYGSGGNARLFDPSYACELRVTSLSPGPVAVSVQMQTFDPRWGERIEDGDICAVDELTLRRFKTYSDDTLVTPELLEPDEYGAYYSGNSPSLYAKGFATKNNRRIMFDWAFAVETSSIPAGEYDDNGVWHPKQEAAESIVNVEANKGAPAKFEVHFESLFARGIDELAAADKNGDGVISPDELRAVDLACEDSTANASSSGYSSSGYSSSGYTDDDDDFAPYPSPKNPRTGSPDTDQCVTLLDQLVRQGTTVLGKIPTKR